MTEVYIAMTAQVSWSDKVIVKNFQLQVTK